MGDESVPFLLDQGTTKTYQIPIGHLDYKFIERCTDVKHLEKILRVLRSGEEGYYPELTLFCEKRIEHLDPGSRALRKDKPAATASDFTADEWKTISGELMSWVTEMNEDDKKSQFLRTDTLHERQDNLPPIRCSSSCLPANQNKKLQNKQRNKKNIPRDYSEWDKFDVEKECSKIDEGCEENNSKARFFSRPSLPIMEKKIDTTGMTEKEKIFIATREKEKGNEAFAIGDYAEAVTYYSRSISVIPTAAAYNNKAQAEIKLQDWDSALQDCDKVLYMEPGNIKALMRRATVHNQLQNYQTAIEDLNKVLRVEPENAIVKKNLLEIEKKLKDLKPVSETQGKGKRILIQDIEDSEGGEERGENTEERERSGGDKIPRVVAVSPQMRLVEDNPSSLSLVEIYKQRCAKKGIEHDNPISRYYDRLATVQARGTQASHQVLRDILKEVQSNMVPRSMLKEWALHTFPNATDYWTFRKMFTIQLALIGFAEFIFHLNRLNPEMLQIAQDTGKLNVAYFRFDINDATGDLDANRPVPFRLTPNISEFLTTIGVSGPLTASMIAVARCFAQPNFKVDGILKTVLRDEIIAWHKKTQEDTSSPLSAAGQPENMDSQQLVSLVQKAVTAIMTRLHNLAQFEGGESKVNTLVAAANSLDNLCRMDPAWHPWL